MPNAMQNLKTKLAMPQALLSTALTIVAICLPAYGAGPIQPPSCEHPPAPPPQIPYPPNLIEIPVNAPAFPPPGSESGPVGPGGPVQPPSCEHPPVPTPPVPLPPGLTQVPVNAPSFPEQPVTPYCPTNYGCIPFHQIPRRIVNGPGNIPGYGIIPGNVIYGLPGTTTLRDPLVPGASFSYPWIPAPLGLLPPLGSGLTPDPVNPGMLGEPPTMVPWADGTAGNPQTHLTNSVVIPSNQIDQPDNTISMPFTNAAAMPPGTWNAQIKAIIPKVPSTPGADPGMLRQPGLNSGAFGKTSTPAAATVALPSNGQLPNGAAPTTRSPDRGQTNDFGLSQKTPAKKTNFAYRMMMSPGSNGQPAVFNGWQGQPGSTTQDFGIGVKQLASSGQLSYLAKPPQTSFDSTRPAQYPGGQSNTGNLGQNSTGNHLEYPNFYNAQVTNDLYGTPMINPKASGLVPLTTIAPY